MLHPAKDIEVVLETLVVVMEVVLVGMSTLVVEEMSVVEVASVAAMVVVVVDMAAVGMAIMMDAVLEVEATRILVITTISLKFWTHERRKLWRQKF